MFSKSNHKSNLSTILYVFSTHEMQTLRCIWLKFLPVKVRLARSRSNTLMGGCLIWCSYSTLTCVWSCSRASPEPWATALTWPNAEGNYRKRKRQNMLSRPMLRLLLSKAEGCKDFFGNYLDPVMLLFKGQLSLSTLRWVPKCQTFNHFSVLLHLFVLVKLETTGIVVKEGKNCFMSYWDKVETQNLE